MKSLIPIDIRPARPPLARAAVAMLALLLSTASVAGAAAGNEAEFRRALIFATQDKTKAAREIIDRLLARSQASRGKKSASGADATSDDVERDRLVMTKARLLYQEGDAKASIEIYKMIPPESDYWLESLEERAWAHLRQGEHGAALAQLKTLRAPLFARILGPEPFFLEGLVHLRVCDYPAVFEAIKSFKSAYRERLVDLQNLAQGRPSEAAARAIAKLRVGAIAWKTIAPEAGKLPRLFHRDEEFLRRIRALKGGQAVDSGYAQQRLQELAVRDLKEAETILSKMHLLEAEVIQRIHIAERPKGRVNRDLELAKGEEVLVFRDTGEYWMDELDKYRIKVRGCPEAAKSGGQ